MASPATLRGGRCRRCHQRPCWIRSFVAYRYDSDIVRLHYAEHWPVGTITTQRGLHSDVVKRVLGLGEPRTEAPRQPRIVEPFHDFIVEQLSSPAPPASSSSSTASTSTAIASPSTPTHGARLTASTTPTRHPLARHPAAAVPARLPQPDHRSSPTPSLGQRRGRLARSPVDGHFSTDPGGR